MLQAAALFLDPWDKLLCVAAVREPWLDPWDKQSRPAALASCLVKIFGRGWVGLAC